MARYKIIRIFLFIVFTAAAFLGFGRFYDDYASQAVDKYYTQLASSFLKDENLTFTEYDNLFRSHCVNINGDETDGLFDVPVTVITENIISPYYFLYESDKLIGLADVPFAKGNIDGIFYDYNFSNNYEYYITEYFMEDGIYHAVKAEYIENGYDKRHNVVLDVNYTDEQLEATISGKIELKNELKHPEKADKINNIKSVTVFAGNNSIGIPFSSTINNDYYMKQYECKAVINGVEIMPVLGFYYKTFGVKLLFLLISIAADVIILYIWSYIENKNAQKAYDAYLAEDYNRKCINALAHDIKSSLMVISTSAENIVADYESTNRKVFDEEITSEIVKLDNLIEKLGQYVATSEIKNALTEDVDITSLVFEIIDNYKKFADKRGLSFKLENKPFTIRADHKLMDMVFDNFVYNAVKYACEGTEIQICITESSFKIYNCWEPVDKYINNPALFFKAYEVGSQERSFKNGSGVGLAISANILDYYKIKYQAMADREGVSFEIIR